MPGVRPAELVVGEEQPDRPLWRLAVIGDGYKAGDEQFTHDVSAFVEELMKTAPFDDYGERIVVYRIASESPKQGPDGGPSDTDPTVRSFFGARLADERGHEKMPWLLTVDTEKVKQAVSDALPAYAFPLVLVNVKEDYGCGSKDGVAACTASPDGFKGGIHELGHVAFGLADEYDDEVRDFRPDFEPREPNVTLDPSGAKWKGLWEDPPGLVPNPVRTGAQPTPVPGVGTFEGARYCRTGIYRPAFTCRMRDLQSPFCPVCEAVIRAELENPQPPPPPPALALQPRSVSFVPDLVADGIPELVAGRDFVLLEGYVAPVDGDASVIALYVDLWMDDRLIIPIDKILHQIPGSNRTERGQSLLWVEANTPLERQVKWTAEQYAYRAVNAEAAGNFQPRRGTNTEWRPGPKFPKV
jgi:hypothetical protein